MQIFFIENKNITGRRLVHILHACIYIHRSQLPDGI